MVQLGCDTLEPTLSFFTQQLGMRVLAISGMDERTLIRQGGLPHCAELMPLPVSPEAVAVRVGRLLLGQRVS